MKTLGVPEERGHVDAGSDNVTAPSPAPASSPASDANALTTAIAEARAALDDARKQDNLDACCTLQSGMEDLIEATSGVLDLERQRASDARELAALRERVASCDALAVDLYYALKQYDNDSIYDVARKIGALAPASTTGPAATTEGG